MKKIELPNSDVFRLLCALRDRCKKLNSGMEYSFTRDLIREIETQTGEKCPADEPRKELKMRYFIIIGNTKGGWFLKGRLFHAVIKCDSYPALKDIEEVLNYPQGVILSNIIELNKADHDSLLGIEEGG